MKLSQFIASGFQQCPDMEYETDRFYEIAKSYHFECEAFDKTVCQCTDEVTGLAMPLNSVERLKMQDNARKVMARLISENSDLPRSQIIKAIANYNGF